ncbi:hypothetical protein BC628DRAFT_1314803, partial [Trametes gibbosa]
RVLVACLKYFAQCPCPQCQINKDKIIEMGTTNHLCCRNWIRVDNNNLNSCIKLVCKWISQKGMSITSVHIGCVLDPLSATPTHSVFSVHLCKHGFNFYCLFIPDLLHEFELGVCKAILTHLLQLLHAVGYNKIQEFNKQYIQLSI